MYRDALKIGSGSDRFKDRIQHNYRDCFMLSRYNCMTGETHFDLISMLAKV